jgi:KaiC/GvpD/RAD55 family RecA-like ATPase
MTDTVEELLAKLERRFPNGSDGNGPPTGGLTLLYGYDAAQPRPLGTVVKGILHAGSVTLIYGPPKSGKSFLATDLAHSIAAATGKPMACDWMGHTIVRPGPVLYVACEGHAGFWKRNAAAANQRGWNRDSFPPGFILATGRPKLIKVDADGVHYAPDPSAILAALEDAKARGLEPVAIVIDTVFRSFGVGNVNASQDMNVYLAAVAELTDRGYAVALVHHETKSSNTPAGSVSLTGGADTIIHVWREGEASERRFWQVEMAKDDAETESRAFTLKVVELGTDPDGMPASSCVVIDEGAAPGETAKRKRGRPASENSEAAILASLIHTELCNLLGYPDEGQPITFYPGAPQVRAVSRTRLRETINRAGILVVTPPEADEAERKRITKGNDKQFARAINRLKNQKKVVADKQWVGVL